MDVLTRLHHQQAQRPDECTVRSRQPTPPHADTSYTYSPGGIGSSANPSPRSEVTGGLTFAVSSHELDTVDAPVVEWDYRPPLLGRAACNFAGLRNGGATCYMNAVLQQLFMQPGVAEAILDVPMSRLDAKSLLYQTQEVSR